MTDDRPRDEDHPEPEVVEGELVDDGAAVGGPLDGGGDVPRPPVTRSGGPPRLASLVGAAAAVLLLNGLLFTLISVPPSLDPAAARCTTARSEIETANENDETFDDVDLDGREVDDLSCDEAIAIAEAIPLDDPADLEEGEEVETVWIPSEGQLRFQLTLILVIGLVQLAGGILVLLRGRRWMRNAAVAGAAVSVIFPVFGLASMLVAGFVVYAMVFSRQSKALWPR